VTPFHDKFSTQEQLETMRQTIPMGRLGTVDECIDAFLYFASERLCHRPGGSRYADRCLLIDRLCLAPDRFEVQSLETLRRLP